MHKVTSVEELAAVLTKQDGESTHRCRHHHHFTRRQFIKSGAATLGAAAIAGSSVTGAAFANHGGNGVPTQLQGFSPVLKNIFGIEIPFFLPVEIDPFLGVFDPVQVPSTMTDFKGIVAMAEVEGVSNTTNNADGVERTWAVDFRYMDGMFIDRNGNRRRGTFGFF